MWESTYYLLNIITKQLWFMILVCCSAKFSLLCHVYFWVFAKRRPCWTVFLKNTDAEWLWPCGGQDWWCIRLPRVPSGPAPQAHTALEPAQGQEGLEGWQRARRHPPPHHPLPPSLRRMRLKCLGLQNLNHCLRHPNTPSNNKVTVACKNTSKPFKIQYFLTVSRVSGIRKSTVKDYRVPTHKIELQNPLLSKNKL